MANEIQVTITGDDELSDVVADAAKKSSKSLGSLGEAAEGAGKKSRDLGESFDKLGEAGGGAEQKFVGFKDSITGTQDVMAGLRDGDVVTLAGGLADLSGAVEALWSSFGKLVVQVAQKVAAQGAEIASTVASTAATVAHTVATFAAEAASKAWAAAQWLLNAAMSANPIGLVVVAIVALVAAIVLAWQHSETFREIVTAAWEAVKNAVETAVSGIVAAFNVVKDTVSNVVSTVQSLFDSLVNFVFGLPGRIWSATQGMFDGIKDAFRSAVNWVIGRWNGLSFGIPEIDTHIPGIGKVGGGSFRVPQIPYLARGGITTGPTLAMLGDNVGGREAVIPLPPGGGGTLGGVTNINVYALDGRGAAEAVVRALRDAKSYGLLAGVTV